MPQPDKPIPFPNYYFRIPDLNYLDHSYFKNGYDLIQAIKGSFLRIIWKYLHFELLMTIQPPSNPMTWKAYHQEIDCSIDVALRRGFCTDAHPRYSQRRHWIKEVIPEHRTRLNLGNKRVTGTQPQTANVVNQSPLPSVWQRALAIRVQQGMICVWNCMCCSASHFATC